MLKFQFHQLLKELSVGKDQSGAAGKNRHLDKKWHSLSLLISVTSFPHLIVFVWVGIGLTVGKIMKKMPDIFSQRE